MSPVQLQPAIPAWCVHATHRPLIDAIQQQGLRTGSRRRGAGRLHGHFLAMDRIFRGAVRGAKPHTDTVVWVQPRRLIAEGVEAHTILDEGLMKGMDVVGARMRAGEAFIPEVLLSGDHARIARWRRAEAERITRERRPDLAGQQSCED